MAPFSGITSGSTALAELISSRLAPAVESSSHTLVPMGTGASSRRNTLATSPNGACVAGAGAAMRPPVPLSVQVAQLNASPPTASESGPLIDVAVVVVYAHGCAGSVKVTFAQPLKAPVTRSASCDTSSTALPGSAGRPKPVWRSNATPTSPAGWDACTS
jgi:hypothetical protein